MKLHEELKKKEIEFLNSEFKKNPKLFERRTIIENDKFLEKFGIYIENKNALPLGYLKYFPSDFIVEEISKSGELYSIVEDSSNPSQENRETQTSFFATLVKRGIGTFEAVEEIAKQLGVSKDSIGIAGLKDKDAITAQRISIKNADLDKIKNITSPFFFLKDITSSKGVVTRGDLFGNKFSILVRLPKKDIDKAFDHVNKSFENLHGKFFNFFYTQRFLGSRPMNFYWAVLLAQGNYQKAVEEFLTCQSDIELPFFGNIRKEIAKNIGNWQKVYDLCSPLPITFEHELKVVESLIKNPNDFVSALKSINHQVEFWMEGLSSWVFNHKLAEFIKNKKTVPGNMPVFVSNNKESFEYYRELVEPIGLYPLNVSNLKTFVYLRDNLKPIETSITFTLHKIEKQNEGVFIQFTLQKGAYATTLLSHIFNLVSGKMPDEFSKEKNSELSHFQDLDNPRSENLFENY